MAKRNAVTAAASVAPNRAVAPTPAAARVPAIDALRAIALIAMVVYHFCFDLRYFGIIRADFEHDPLWLTARTLILSSFLLLAGVSLVLADRNAATTLQFWRRVAEIAACALIVSIASYAMFPATFIWFGVLHAIAVTLVLARPFVREPIAALAIGVVIIVAGIAFSHPLFDRFSLGWIGFMTSKPYTEDYVPLFPWAGALFCGIAAGHALVRNRFAIVAPLAAAPRWLTWAGRHTLAIYMLHQPALIGALWLFVKK